MIRDVIVSCGAFLLGVVVVVWSTERLLASVRWIGVDEPIARTAGEFGRSFRGSHRSLSTPDLIVAATAEVLGAGLATMNVRDFPMFKGLRAPY